MPDSTSDSESKITETRDGSHTVYSSRFDQHYHNPNGAIAESRYVFFEKTGLLHELENRKRITILEIGFGTGLNLMLLLDYLSAQGSECQIDFYSIEAFPLSPDTANELNYGEHLNQPDTSSKVISVFEQLHKGMNRMALHDKLTLHLFNGLFEDFPDLNISADFVFHDAFSPDVNPDLWTGEVFQKIARLSADDVILSTYCAASKAKGAMAWAGWKLAKTRGALGKREMTLASLNADRLSEYKRVNEERLAERYEDDDF